MKNESMTSIGCVDTNFTEGPFTRISGTREEFFNLQTERSAGHVKVKDVDQAIFFSGPNIHKESEKEDMSH